jgi:hypothetical protein
MGTSDRERVCMCVCVCVRERDRERERKREREGERKRRIATQCSASAANAWICGLLPRADYRWRQKRRRHLVPMQLPYLSSHPAAYLSASGGAVISAGCKLGRSTILASVVYREVGSP